MTPDISSPNKDLMKDEKTGARPSTLKGKNEEGNEVNEGS